MNSYEITITALVREFKMQILAWSFNDAFFRAETIAAEEYECASVSDVVEL